MTVEAKDVFINAVHYIARFAGRQPIARKKSGTMVRSAIDRAIDSMSDEAYARTVATFAEFEKENVARKAALRKRIEAGERVTDLERQVLSMGAIEAPSRVSQAERFISASVMQDLGGDPVKITAHLEENRPFYRPSGWYTLAVDEDLKKLELPNDDMALLDRFVVMWLVDDDRGLSRTLLERYTDQSFATAVEWARWLEANRSRLFFTETGGYKWLVDTTGSPAKPTPEEASRAKPGASRQSRITATPESPLASDLVIRSLGDDRFELTLNVVVLEGWHAYDSVPDNSPYAPLTLELELPQGVRRVGEWKKPKAHLSPEDPGLTLFEGRMAFRCEIEGELTPAVTCDVSYQVCDAAQCMPPTTTRVTASHNPRPARHLRFVHGTRLAPSREVSVVQQTGGSPRQAQRRIQGGSVQ